MQGLFFTGTEKYMSWNCWMEMKSSALFINKMLLTGYYLLNLGYAAMSIRFMEHHRNLGAASRYRDIVLTGKIMMILASYTFVNMTVIFLISQ